MCTILHSPPLLQSLFFFHICSLCSSVVQISQRFPPATHPSTSQNDLDTHSQPFFSVLLVHSQHPSKQLHLIQDDSLCPSWLLMWVRHRSFCSNTVMSYCILGKSNDFPNQCLNTSNVRQPEASWAFQVLFCYAQEHDTSVIMSVCVCMCVFFSRRFS